MPTVTIIGIGRVGGSLSKIFKNSDFQIEHLIGHNSDLSKGIVTLDSVELIGSDIVLIAVGDNSIGTVSNSIFDKISQNSIVLHLSGSLSSEILHDLKKRGCSVGSMHPLVSISSSDFGIERFNGTFFCIEGDAKATECAEAIVKFLGGKSFTISSELKSLYHAAAVTASGHVTALIDLAVEMMKRSGVPPDNALEILMPLIQSTILNIAEHGTAAALTGPFARADSSVFERQIEPIEMNLSSDEAEIYLSLALRSLKLAAERGTNLDSISELESMIRIVKSDLHE